MEYRNKNRVESISNELRDIRSQLSVSDTTAIRPEVANWLLDPQFLQELELTSEFVRLFKLERCIARRDKPSSTINDVVESMKLRHVVEELQKKRIGQCVRNGNDGSTTHGTSFEMVCQIANQTYLDMKG